MEAVLQSTGDKKELEQEQDENRKIYDQFVVAKNENNAELAEGTDSVFGAGISEYVASEILKYYGG